MTQPLEITLDVEVGQRHAFDTWTARFDSWWPRSHTVGGREDAVVELEPRLGGAIGERLPDGTHHTWGRVTVWEPPAEFGYDWHFGRESADATRVRVWFVALDQDLTRVEIRHGGWEALGDEAVSWRIGTSADGTGCSRTMWTRSRRRHDGHGHERRSLAADDGTWHLDVHHVARRGR